MSATGAPPAAAVRIHHYGLALALARCGQQPAPATETPGVTAATTAPTDVATEELGTPTATPAPTATPTEGEKVAEAVGQEYTAYRPTQAKCDEAFEIWEVEAHINTATFIEAVVDAFDKTVVV